MEQKAKKTPQRDRVKEQPDRGLFLGDSGRRFWFNTRVLNSVTRTPMSELARSAGLTPSTLHQCTYRADAHGYDVLSLVPVLTVSDFYDIPADFLLHADQARIVEVAQKKRFEKRGLGTCPEIDPYHIAFMDCLNFKGQQEVMKMVYAMLGMSEEEIDRIVIPDIGVEEAMMSSGMPKIGSLSKAMEEAEAEDGEES